MRLRIAQTLVLPLVFIVASAAPSAVAAGDRVVAVGDVHGSFDGLVSILRHAELIDDDNHWIGGTDTLGQTGDLFDRGLQIRRALDRFFREHGVQREVAYEFDNIQMIKEALSIGQGVSILPERTVRQEVTDGRLVSLPIEAEGLVRPVGILMQRKKRLSGAGERFLEFLRDRAS